MWFCLPSCTLAGLGWGSCLSGGTVHWEPELQTWLHYSVNPWCSYTSAYLVCSYPPRWMLSVILLNAVSHSSQPPSFSLQLCSTFYCWLSSWHLGCSFKPLAFYGCYCVWEGLQGMLSCKLLSLLWSVNVKPARLLCQTSEYQEILESLCFFLTLPSWKTPGIVFMFHGRLKIAVTSCHLYSLQETLKKGN